LLLHAIATRVRHARQITITVASSHARAVPPCYLKSCFISAIGLKSFMG
jgi:hypothetical protein